MGIEINLALQVYKQREENTFALGIHLLCKMPSKLLSKPRNPVLFVAFLFLDLIQETFWSFPGLDSPGQDTARAIEDSVAVYTENTIRPSDIKRLCDACRCAICRPVSMTENIPRDETSLDRSDNRFDPGPTPRSIRICILFVRKKLWSEDGTHIIFVSQVREKYNSVVFDVGALDFW